LILEEELLGKNKVVVWNHPCRYDDKSSQEGGDDGSRPTTNSTRARTKRIKEEWNSTKNTKWTFLHFLSHDLVVKIRIEISILVNNLGLM